MTPVTRASCSLLPCEVTGLSFRDTLAPASSEPALSGARDPGPSCVRLVCEAPRKLCSANLGPTLAPAGFSFCQMGIVTALVTERTARVW